MSYPYRGRTRSRQAFVWVVVASAVVALLLVISNRSSAKEGPTKGFVTMKVDDDTYRIVHREGHISTGHDPKDLTMLKSAELALDNGYSYFEIIEGGQGTAKLGYTTPRDAKTHGTAFEGGSHDHYQAGRTTTSGGKTYKMENPVTSFTIKCYKKRPSGTSGKVYDAKVVKGEMTKKLEKQ